MCTWRKILNSFLLGALLMSAAGVAQEERLVRAEQLYRAKETEQALAVIDSVIAHPQTKSDFVSWTTRAFIYFDLYKRSDKYKLDSPLRDSVLSSIRTSESLKPDSLYAKNNRMIVASLAAGYFNICKALLQDSVDYKRSLIAYNRFKELYLQANPGANLARHDIEYNLAVGSIYVEKFNKNNKDTEAEEIAKLTLMRVLEVQPDNPSALINMGLMYYNQAANLSRQVDYGVDFSEVDVVQDNMVKLAKQAEQFIEKAYSIDNKNPKAVEALFYIYRILNEIQKSDEFRKKCEQMGIDFEKQDQSTNNNNDKK